MFGRIDHIGVAVESIDVAIGLYRDGFGMREQHRETVEAFGVEAVLLEVGEGHVELISPLSGEGGVARFLERNGEGVHHVGYEVPDIEAALGHLQQEGARLIDEQPRRGSRGAQIAFVHPKGGLGTLVELVQEGSAQV